MEGALYSLLGGFWYINQRLMEVERYWGEKRYRANSLVRQVNEAKGMVVELRYREYNTRAEDIRGINNEMTNMGN